MSGQVPAGHQGSCPAGHAFRSTQPGLGSQRSHIWNVWAAILELGCRPGRWREARLASLFGRASGFSAFGPFEQFKPVVNMKRSLRTGGIIRECQHSEKSWRGLINNPNRLIPA